MKQKTGKTIVKTAEASYNKDEQREEALKSFESLTLADRFIFFRVMQDADLCKRLLEIILGVEIERIEYDVNLLSRGEDYRLLNRSYVIFICMDDIFGKGRHIYTFENICREDAGLVLGDGTVKIFLNPYSDMEDVTPELGNFLRYLAEGVAVDEYTERLVEAVETAKKDPRLMVEYMSYYAEQADRRAEREESRAEGHAEGIKEGHAAGIKEGHAAGLEEGMVRGVIQTIKTLNGTMEEASEQLILQRGMSKDEAAAAVRKYW